MFRFIKNFIVGFVAARALMFVLQAWSQRDELLQIVREAREEIAQKGMSDA